MQYPIRPLAILCLAALFLSGAVFSNAPPEGSDKLKPIDVSGFQSSISHWRNLKDDTRFIKVVEGQATYKPSQVREIVENILLFQRSNGGWPKDYDMTAVLTSEQREIVLKTRSNQDSS